MDPWDPIAVHNHIADVYAEEFTEPSSHLDTFLKYLPRSSRILDAGCGPGVDADYMDSRGYEVVGVDLAENMLEIARETTSNVEFKEADIRRLDFSDFYFDGIVSSLSLPYIPKSDIPRVISDFYHMLAKGGCIFLLLHKGESSEGLKPDPLYEGKVFMNIMSEGEITEILEQHGFTIKNRFERSPVSEAEFDYDLLYIIGEANVE